MIEATVVTSILTLAFLLIIGGFLVWGIRSGQFHNIEESKYIPFKDDASGEKPGSSGERQGGDA